MELRELRTLCTAARLGSVSEAAQALDISQPSASRHIHDLEKSLGVTLVRPDKRPFQLTSEGLRLVSLAAPLLEGFDRLTLEMRDREQRPLGVGAPQGTVSHFLPSVVRDYWITFNRPVRLAILDKGRILEGLDEGTIELGLIANPEVPPRFDFYQMFKFRRVLITPAGHPLAAVESPTWDDIAKHPLVARLGTAHSRSVIEPPMKRIGARFQVALALSNMEPAIRYVRLGVGIAVCSESSIATQGRAGIEVIDLSHLMPPEQVGIVTLRERVLSQDAQDFVDLMEAAAAPIRAMVDAGAPLVLPFEA